VSRAAYAIPRRITETPGGMGPLAMTVLIERLIHRATCETLPPWGYPLPVTAAADGPT
jgi:hypothetical protein